MRLMRPLSFGALSLLLVACSKPSPPGLEVKSGRLANISPTGVGVELTLAAWNGNDVDLAAGNVRAHVVLDKRIEVGAATVEQRVTLPAHQTTDLQVSATIPWANLLPLAQLTLGDRQWIPYNLDGTMTLGGDLLNVDVPFKTEGRVSREELLRATLNSIPGAPSVDTDGAAPPDPAVRPHPAPGHPHTRH
jgi:LEA14-like dessication related protein